jgi:hypothetical protein
MLYLVATVNTLVITVKCNRIFCIDKDSHKILLHASENYFAIIRQIFTHRGIM